MKRLIEWLIPVCGMLMPLGAWALSSDREQPIVIEADRLDVDDAKGVSTYSGNVEYSQGSIRLLADTLVVYTDEARELKRVVAEGEPARFSQQLDKAGQIVRGQAQTIEYTTGTEKLVLEGSAHLWQDGDEFAGNQIEYFSQQELVKAAKAPDGEGRVQVILQPRTDTPPDGADAGGG